MANAFISRKSVSCIAHTLHYKTKNTKLISSLDPQIVQELNGMLKQMYFQEFFKNVSISVFIVLHSKRLVQRKALHFQRTFQYIFCVNYD